MEVLFYSPFEEFVGAKKVSNDTLRGLTRKDPGDDRRDERSAAGETNDSVE